MRIRDVLCFPEPSVASSVFIHFCEWNQIRRKKNPMWYSKLMSQFTHKHTHGLFSTDFSMLN